MKNYMWIRSKLVIRSTSLLHWLIMHVPTMILGVRIGYYQTIRIGKETNWHVWNWNGYGKGWA